MITIVVASTIKPNNTHKETSDSSTQTDEHVFCETSDSSTQTDEHVFCETTDSSTQTDERVFCETCDRHRTVLANHMCIIWNSVEPTAHQLLQAQMMRNLKFPAQIGDILLKLRFNQRLGFVDSPRLQSIENRQILADWAITNGLTGASSRLLAEKLEAHFSQNLALLDRYLDEMNVPLVTVNTLSLPQL